MHFHICNTLRQYTRIYSLFPVHRLTAPSVIITRPPTKGGLQRKMLVYVCNILLSPQTIDIAFSLLGIFLNIAKLFQLYARKDMHQRQG